MVTTILVLPSCRSHNSGLYTLHRDSVAYTIHQTTDTIYQHDSIFIKEYIRGDTIYLTRTEYRDRWRTRLVYDTICNTRYIEKLIEHPPERYVPKLYKCCTILCFLFILFFFLRLFLAFKL